MLRRLLHRWFGGRGRRDAETAAPPQQPRAAPKTAPEPAAPVASVGPVGQRRPPSASTTAPPPPPPPPPAPPARPATRVVATPAPATGESPAARVLEELEGRFGAGAGIDPAAEREPPEGAKRVRLVLKDGTMAAPPEDPELEGRIDYLVDNILATRRGEA